MIDKIIRLIKVERVDDIPVLLAQVPKMPIPALLELLSPLSDPQQRLLEYSSRGPTQI